MASFVNFTTAPPAAAIPASKVFPNALARLLPNCDPVHEVSIIPRGQAAGYTMTRPDTDDNHLTKAKLLDDIVMTLGGRVAEELIIKDISAGASGDIQAVSKRARLMVTEWGMSEKVGPISYGSDKEVFIGRDMASHVSYSEQTAAVIDSEIADIVNNALQKARDLLSKNKRKCKNTNHFAQAYMNCTILPCAN